MTPDKLNPLIAPSFASLHRQVLNGGFSHYWLKGGRGSAKSSFISLEIVLGVMRDPNANAVVLRKVGTTLRDSVFEQVVWAVEKLQVADLWEQKKTPSASSSSRRDRKSCSGAGTTRRKSSR